ncbi:MAG: N-acetylmuramoyl-L-alanine amidase [Deltaproteobacteria bacterium]|nr:MAG: N-acetylmuramoyl-L-alanine amidase [Deltaproteobacteria bacterium]
MSCYIVGVTVLDPKHYLMCLFCAGLGLAVGLGHATPTSAHPGHHPSHRSSGPPQAKASSRTNVKVAQESWGNNKKLADIRYEIKRKHTRVVVLIGGGRLSGVAEGEAPAKPRIGLPFRVYVDLTPCIPLRYWTRSAFRMGGKRIRKLRVGRNTLKTTRVVLELRRKLDYRVTMLRNPMRIVIDVGRTLPNDPKTSMTMPSDSPTPVGRWRRTRRKRQHHHHHHGHQWTAPNRRKGSWRPAKGQPWVIRQPMPKRLPFAFRVRSIAIDAGHGGQEDGAVGRSTRLAEKMVTLDIAKRVKRILRKRLRRTRVFLVRRRDRTMTLDQRVKRVKQGGADLMISIHANSNLNRKVSGISTYVLHWNQRFNVARMLSSNALLARENQGIHPKQFNSGVSAILDSMALKTNLILSKTLGVVIQNSLMKRVLSKYRRIRDLGVRRGLFYLLYATGIPSILVEASFLSNRREELLLRTQAYRNKIAQGIADGVVRFVRLSRQSLRRRRRYPRLPRKRSRSRRKSKKKRRRQR